jgi:hypothetical protein
LDPHAFEITMKNGISVISGKFEFNGYSML